MSTILLLGAHGQVGQELRRTLAPLGHLVAIDRSQLDLACSDSIRRLIHNVKPEIIVNAAAYTAVDRAELEPELAHAINAVAPTAMAEEAERTNALLVHLSTDYVFNGVHHIPYSENDTTSPTNVYGKSKLAGEEGIRYVCPTHLILRTAWVYGCQGRGNFVKTMLRLGCEREELRVVVDQIGTPTYAKDIATTTTALIKKVCLGSSFHPALLGTYHITNSGVASWYDFAVAIFEEAESIGFPLKAIRVVPITTPEYPTPASRPAYSVLSCQKISVALGEIPPHWRLSLKHMLVDLYSQIYESTYSVRR